MDILQPYCNRDGTVRYVADTVDLQCRQKRCKTARSPDIPVRDERGDVELIRKRSLVRVQAGSLSKIAVLQVKIV